MARPKKTWVHYVEVVFADGRRIKLREFRHPQEAAGFAGQLQAGPPLYKVPYTVETRSVREEVPRAADDN